MHMVVRFSGISLTWLAAATLLLVVVATADPTCSCVCSLTADDSVPQVLTLLYCMRTKENGILNYTKLSTVRVSLLTVEGTFCFYCQPLQRCYM